MPNFVVDYSLVSGAATTVVGSAGGDDVLVLNWGAATINQGLSMVVPDVAGDAGGGGQIGMHNYVTYSFMERFQVTTGAGQDDFTLGNGNDIASMGDGNDSVNTRAGEAQVTGGNGTDRWAVNWSGLSGAIAVNLQTNTMTGVGASSVNSIEQLGYGFANQFRTGSGNDVLTTLIGPTATHDDYIQTGAGNDTFVAGGGVDTVDMGAGGDDLLVVDFSWIANGIASSRTGSGLDWNGIFQPGSAGPNAVIYSNVARFDIRGATGADAILTGSNNDTVNSGTGNDQIDTEAGEVVLNGGADVDSWAANYTALSTAVTVNLQNSTIAGVGGSTIAGIEALGYGFSNQFRTGSGNDVLTTLTGTSVTYTDYIQTNSGNDTVLVGGGADTVDLGVGGNDVLIVDYSAFANGIVTGGSFGGSGLDWGGLYQIGGAGPDYVFFSNVARFDIRGASGGDAITTGGNNDTIRAGAGKDTVNAGAGDDDIDTGTGEFILDGGTGWDTWSADFTGLTGAINVNLQTGIFTGLGASTLTGIEALGGGNFDGRFRTGSGNDVLITRQLGNTSARDDIETFAGDDTVLVAGGSDLVDLGVLGDDVLIVDYSSYANGITTSSFNGAGADWNGVFGIGFLQVEGAVSFENVGRFDIRGTTGNDNILTGSNNDTIASGTGIDTISAGAGNDSLNGGDGADNLSGGIGNDTLQGGAGADSISGESGTADWAFYASSTVGVQVSLMAGAVNTGGDAAGDVLTGIERLFGSTFNDVLTGDAGINRLSGNSGNDTLQGGAGVDSLIGGAGTADWASYASSATAVQVSRVAGAVNTGGDAAGDVLADIERLFGSTFNDVLTGNAGVNRLSGNSGDDTLQGGAGADSIYGGAGSNDWAVYASSATAVQVSLVAGAVNTGGDAAGDVLADIERLFGSTFNDVLTGNAGINRLSGNSGDDTLQGGAGADSIYGGAGTADTASYANSATAVQVSLVTGAVNTGGDAAGDVLADIEGLSGSAFGDVLTGNAGANNLYGNSGNDMLQGGLGADRFYFDTVLNAATNMDTIADFSVVDDFIMLENAVFTALTTGGALAAGRFAVVAAGGNATTATQNIVYEQSTGRLFYDADGSSSGAKIHFASVTANTALTAGDFWVY